MAKAPEKRLKALEIVKGRGKEGISIAELSRLLHCRTANVNVFDVNDMIYEDVRGDGLYLVWCGKE